MPIEYNEMRSWTAACLIELWIAGGVQLTRKEMGVLMEVMQALLERAAAEQWRLLPDNRRTGHEE